MLKSTAELECDCGTKEQPAVTHFDYERPGTFSPVTKHVKCQHCGSTYTFRFVKVPSGNVRFTMSLSAASRTMAERIAQKKILAGERVPVKKAPQFFMPGFRRPERLV